jgi:hypothetical protein
MADEIKEVKDLEQELTLKGVIDFLEYEEALTTDKATANRIRTLLTILGVWN